MKSSFLYILVILAVLTASCKSNSKQKSENSALETNTTVSQAVYPEWSVDATLYEVNLRQYTPEGTLSAFEEHLPRLQKLGVEILWLMPMHPISEAKRKGTLGSYYAVADYKAINPEFGTLDEFKTFVEKAHEMGFKIILDWVANHTGWDNPWIYEHPEWYTSDSLGNIIPPDPDWSDVADLNFDVPEMRNAMIDAMEFWVREANIDGYRCDVAWGVPTDFWNDARAALDSIKPVWMLAEDEEHKDFLINAFNCNYSWSLHHSLNLIAKGEEDINAIKDYFADAETSFPEGSYTMQFTSNHDENSWQGTVYERMGDATNTMAALTFTIPGIPLIYSGQEAALNKRLAFFEKDEIDWSNLEMQDFYEKLVDLKKTNKALWNGDAGAGIHFLKMKDDNDLLAFSRELDTNKLVCLFNLSDEPLSNTVLCETIVGNYTDYFSKEAVRYEQNAEVALAPWEYKILIAGE